MSEDPLAQLLAAAQGALHGIRELNPWAQVIHAAHAAVQAGCAVAVSIEHLASAVDRLVDVIAPPEGETP